MTDKEAVNFYKKSKKKIEKHGYMITGTIAGKDSLERPLAYTIGSSIKTGFEFVSFFPVKQQKDDPGTKIVSKVINNIISKEYTIDNQIIDDEEIYYLPIAMLLLDENTKNDVESIWACQLERDALLSEFSTDDHKLVLLIFTDKNGNLPWKEKCESYWPLICPPPLVAMAELAITGQDKLLSKLEKQFKLKK